VQAGAGGFRWVQVGGSGKMIRVAPGLVALGSSFSSKATSFAAAAGVSSSFSALEQ